MSVDTSEPEVMRAGAGRWAPTSSTTCARCAGRARCEAVAAHPRAGVCLMHMQRRAGARCRPSRSTATWSPRCAAFLRQRVAAVAAAGIARERIAARSRHRLRQDRGRTTCAAVRARRELLALGLPLLVGWSRKCDAGPAHRAAAWASALAASVAAALAAVQRGAAHRARARRGGDRRCAQGLAGGRAGRLPG
ncbi:MAG: dihydropteroate synthase [Comamonadaceae bacterium]|nr:dihydropteroate synthase [Comamonadaceae bacterium]